MREFAEFRQLRKSGHKGFRVGEGFKFSCLLGMVMSLDFWISGLGF